MNVEQTKQAIAVMQAFVEGKHIQWRRQDRLVSEWKPILADAPTWDWYSNEYRVKPQTFQSRKYLCSASSRDGFYTLTWDSFQHPRTQEQVEKEGRFVRWLEETQNHEI